MYKLGNSNPPRELTFFTIFKLILGGLFFHKNMDMDLSNDINPFVDGCVTSFFSSFFLYLNSPGKLPITGG